MKEARYIGAAVGLLLLGPSSGAAQAILPQESPTFNRKVRNLGMGNVGVALPGGSFSPFYNPAGLDDVSEGRIDILGITGEFGLGATDVFKDLKDLNSDLDKLNGDTSGQLERFDEFVQAHVGEFQHVRTTFELVNYTRPHFGVGMVIDERMVLSLRDQSYPNFYVRNLGDAVLFLSTGWGFWDKALQVGATVRPTVRFALDEADQTFTYADAVGSNALGDLEQITDPRFALAVDVGFKSNLAPILKKMPGYDYLRPELGLTWQDLGNTSFSNAETNQQSISTGLSVHADVWKLENLVALDFRDLNREMDFLSKVHFGVESKTPWFVSLRAGMNGGYFATGASLDFKYVVLETAYYWEEVGRFTREAGEDRLAFTLRAGL